MKRLFTLLVCVLVLLCGCTGQQDVPESTLPPVSQPSEPVTRPQSFGEYDADSPVELLTHGAVKRYCLSNQGHYALKIMGEGVLLFSGETETTLTRLCRDANPVSVTLKGCLLDVGDGAVRIGEGGITYYDETDSTLVTLDGALKETTRVSLPSNMESRPVLSQDRQWVYYYAEGALRSLELRTGISRLLQESTYPIQKTKAVYFDGKILLCRVGTEDETQFHMISTETGKTLQILTAAPALTTWGDRFFTQWYETEEWKLLFGTLDGDVQRLPVTQEGECWAQPEADALVVSQTDVTGTTLTWYPLWEDEKVSTVRLPGVGKLTGVDTEAEKGFVWFLSDDINKETQSLYCWDPSVSTVDQTVMPMPYYTRENPDKSGLEACASEARELADRYGIRIRIWNDAVDAVPDGYVMTSEYQVKVYQQYLVALEKLLAQYPKEIFTRLGRKSQNGRLTVCLVSEVYGSNELGSLVQETGVHYWHNGNAYLTLVMNEQFSDSFNHELFHAMDIYILTECKAYDFWDTLNPKGFVYDFSYVTNEYREPEDYLDSANRAFIDVYSMSYPREDRARVMEYAMQTGNAAFFTSDIMQAKLDMISKGIREAFRLKGPKGEYLWEQYLK